MNPSVSSPLTGIDDGFGASYRLTTLGELRLVGPDGAERLAGRRKELALLAFLARRSPRAAPRQELASLLWEERDGAKARQSLRHALLQLRRALGDAIEATADYARIDAKRLETDATAFECEIATGRPAEAVARWHGDFLARVEDVGGESFRAWVEAEREGLRRRLASALDGLIADAVQRRNGPEAVTWAERWVEALPLDEPAHRRLIEVLTTAGRPDDALARHASFTARLREELDEEPSPTFTTLRDALSRDASRRHASPAGSAALLTPDMVGRDAAFAELVAAWHEARSGRTTAVLLAGEEGFGKTRMCQEFVRWLRSKETDAQILSARACAAENDAAWSTARELLGNLGDAPGLFGAAPAALATVARLVPSVTGGHAAMAPNEEPVAAATELVALCEVLEAVASEVPVLLVLDDAPLADSATQRMLAALVSRAAAGTMLLITGRPDALSASLAAEELRRDRCVRRVRLQPLGLTDTEALVRSMVALVPDDASFLAERLHNDSGGNPLYITELVFALADEGTLLLGEDGRWHVQRAVVQRQLPLPAGLREAVKARLEVLSDDERLCVDSVAIADGPIDPALLERMTELPSERLARAIDRLLTRRLLRELSTSELTSYELAHEVFRRMARELVEESRRHGLEAGLGNAWSGARASESSPVATLDNDRRRRAAWRRRVTIGGVVAAVVCATVVFATRRANRVAGSATDGNGARSIAVLPFVNIGSDSGNEYFSDGITEELINTLARVQGFHIPARTSSFAFKGKSIGVTDIGRQLHVGAVLEGSVRRSGKELRVTAQLIDVASGYELWSDVYDRELTDILRVEEEIARAIVAKLRGALLSDSIERLASQRMLNPEAHDLYLRGRYFWNQRNELSLNKSIQYFERALALDPEYAMAYAGLADSYAILGANGFRALGEVLPKAEAAATKAIALDGSISSVHATRALIHWLEWKWPTADDEFRRSVALDSAYVPARLWYALYLSGMGHSAEAIREITRARELDPLSLIVNTERGRVLELARRDTAAVEAYAQALEIDSTYELANSLLAQISLRTRRFELADQAIARLMQSSEWSALTDLRAYAYAVRGNGSAARQALAQITGPRTTRYVSPYSVACIYAALHETPRALEWLEKAYAAHSSEMTALAVDPALDPVRTDPRFRRLMRRMHLDE